jgi:hypothetical protein
MLILPFRVFSQNENFSTLLKEYELLLVDYENLNEKYKSLNNLYLESINKREELLKTVASNTELIEKQRETITGK